MIIKSVSKNKEIQKKFHCNVCSKLRSAASVTVRSDNVSVLFCNDCGMGVIDPIPDDLNHFYMDDYYQVKEGKVDGYSNYTEMAEHGTLWAVGILDALEVSSGKILDVGCANGYLLNKLPSATKKYGIETNPDAAKEAKNSDVNIISNDLFDISLEKKYANFFDVITSIATFEHLPNFKGGIERCISFLKKDGILLFEVPLISEIHPNDVWYKSSLEHVYYPTIKGLENLFTEQLKLPFVGAEVNISGFGSTYIGLVAYEEKTLKKYHDAWLRIVTPENEGKNNLERRAKVLLYSIHAVAPFEQSVASLEYLTPEDITPSMLARIGYQWNQNYRSAKANKDKANYQSKILLEQGYKINMLEGEINERDLKIATVIDENKVQYSKYIKVFEEKNIKAKELQNRINELENLENKAAKDRAYVRELLVARDFHAEQSDRWKELFISEEFKLANLMHEKAILKRNLFQKARQFGIRCLHYALLRDNFVKLLGRIGIKQLYKASPKFAILLEKNLRNLLNFSRVKLLKSNQLNLTTAKPKYSQLKVDNKLHPANLPLVSIIIPCFNYGRYVAEAVNSALNQTFKQIEIIVVDGGSTDGVTPSLVMALETDNVQVFLRDKRHRVSSNRNFGIEKAKGKYICCLDADDTLDPTYIETAVFFAETYGYDLVSPSVQIFGEKNEGYDVAKDIDLEVLLRGNEVTTSSLFKKHFWEIAGGYKDYGNGSPATHVHEDWDFWIRIAAHGARIFGLQGCRLFNYRHHGNGSLSNEEGVRPLIDHLKDIKNNNASILTKKAISKSIKLRLTPICIEAPWINLLPVQQENLNTIMVLLPWTVLGGAEKLLSGILKSLSLKGWKVIIVTTLRPNPDDGSTRSLFEEVTPYIYDLPKVLANLDVWESYLMYLAKVNDVTHILMAGSSFGYGQLSSLKKEIPKLRIVDLLFNTIGHTRNNRLHALSIDCTIVENSDVKLWLLEHGETEDRIELIKSGVPIPRAKQITTSKFLKGVNAENKFIIGFSGRWSEEKDPVLFVKIACNLANKFKYKNKLCFVMTGTGKLKSNILFELSKSPSLDGIFHLLENVEDISNVIRSYDVLVIPSKLDGRPVVAMEALAMGVPVVASKVGGLPELIIPGETGDLCSVGDIDDFVESIANIINDQRSLKRQKAAAKTYARKYLNENLMFESYEKVLLGSK